MLRLLLLGSLLFTACSPALTEAPPRPLPSEAEPTVWALDYFRTRPGQQARYLRFLEANWKPLRERAIAAGFVRSHRVLVRPPEVEDWDVLLLTEYADSSAFAQREALFRPLLADHTLIRIDSFGPRDLADATDTTTIYARSTPFSP